MVEITGGNFRETIRDDCGGNGDFFWVETYSGVASSGRANHGKGAALTVRDLLLVGSLFLSQVHRVTSCNRAGLQGFQAD